MLPDDEVDINGGINLESGDVLDDGGWAVDIDDSLVDSHLISVVGVGSLTAWRFSCGNDKVLGWHSAWSLGFITLVLSSLDDLVASPLKWLNFSSFKGHSRKK